MDLIDLHCHLLPGIDDGPTDLEGAVSLAEAYLSAGITRVAATPHVNLRHRNRPGNIGERRTELTTRLAELGIGLRVEAGAEISATVAAEIGYDELRSLTLGGGDWLLVEPPTRAAAFDIHQSIFEIQQRGFKVLLAHPERNPALQRDLDLLGDLVAAGMRTQVTAEALTGRFGSNAEACARELFSRNLVHTVASDAHHATDRPPGLSNELKRSGHRNLVQWLCHDMPAWILDGGEEPSRPGTTASGDSPERGGLLRRLGLRR